MGLVHMHHLACCCKRVLNGTCGIPTVLDLLNLFPFRGQDGDILVLSQGRTGIGKDNYGKEQETCVLAQRKLDF